MDANTKKEFLAAYDNYADAIYRHCFFRIFSAARAEELTQEAFLKVWEYLGRGKKVDNLRAFLYRVATNLVIDDVRKRKEDSLEKILEEAPQLDPSYDGHVDVERQAELKEILRTMHKLPQETRELLTLRYVDDLDPREIAEIQGTTANNISVKLNRAMKTLKKEYESDESR